MSRNVNLDKSARASDRFRRFRSSGIPGTIAPTRCSSGSGQAVLKWPARLLAMGRSHVQALIKAQANRPATGQSSDGNIRFNQMLDPRFNPHVSCESGSDLPDSALNKLLQQETGGTDEVVPIIIVCLGGNEHHFVGLADHPGSCAFVLPSARNLQWQPGAENIPALLMERPMRHHAVAKPLPRAPRDAYTEKTARLAGVVCDEAALDRAA